MIKQIGKFRINAGAQGSWLETEGGPGRISLRKDDLLDLKYAAEFALRTIEEEEKRQL